MSLRTLPWYDRNAVSLADSYTGTTGPHAVTVRISSYTVAKHKKAMVELLNCLVVRTTVASDDKDVMAYFTLVPKGGSAKTMLLAVIHDKTVGAKDKSVIGATLVMHEGDILTGLSYDGSADGAIRYSMAYKISEFDAYPIEIPPFQVEMPIKDIQEQPPKDPKM